MNPKSISISTEQCKLLNNLYESILPTFVRSKTWYSYKFNVVNTTSVAIVKRITSVAVAVGDAGLQRSPDTHTENITIVSKNFIVFTGITQHSSNSV